MSATPTTNRTLADRARAKADAAMRLRRAWLAASVALDTTLSVSAARAALADVRDLAVRNLATQVIDQLEEEAGE